MKKQTEISRGRRDIPDDLGDVWAAEPDECANCDQGVETMPLVRVDVNGTEWAAWVCQACGHAHLVSRPELVDEAPIA